MVLNRAMCIFLLCSLEPLLAQGLVSSECQSNSLRLPRRAKPVHYELGLKVSLEDMLFSGHVEIELHFDLSAPERDQACRAAGSKVPLVCDPSKIILHAEKSLDVWQVVFSETEPRGASIKVKGICRDKKSGQLVVSLARRPKFDGKLKLWFNGQVAQDADYGLYRSEHVGLSGSDKPMVVTQFESGHARTVFPLFDEPDLKATFGLTIWHERGFKALSNMPATSESPDDYNFVKVQFERTPLMSSYLLAFAIGEFDHIEETILGGNMTIRMWTPPGRAEDSRLTLNIATRAYEMLLDYFKIEQPVKKIDFVAVDKFDGAMENWGLVTFQTVQMLHGKREKESARDQFFVLDTIVHELAHHWFGNLVTMKWWDDLWLNEGFASWMASYLCERLFPGFGFEMNHLTSTMTPALTADADVDRTHPIKNQKLKTIEEIEKSFDTITYRKAECVIRMLNDYVGADKFQEGLQKYVARHMFGNTDADDLWAILKEVSGLEVESLVDTWIYQAGHPLVEVSLDEKFLDFRQGKFAKASRLGMVKRKGGPSQIRWQIPISVRVSNGKDKVTKMKFVLGDNEGRVKLPHWFDVKRKGHWLKVNADFEGFYRVHYKNKELRDALREAIKANALKPADRLNIVDDTRALRVAKLITKDELAEVISWFGDEHDDAVMIEIVKLFHWMAANDAAQLVADHLSIVRNYYAKTGGVSSRADGTGLKEKARLAVARLLLLLRDSSVLRDSLAEFKATRGRVAPFLQTTIYPAVAHAGSERQFRDILASIAKVDSASTRRQLLTLVRDELDDNPHRLQVVRRHLAP